MAEIDLPKAPKGQKTAGRRSWREIHAVYEFPFGPEMHMLVEEAARTADVVARLQDIVDNATTLRPCGIGTSTPRRNPRSHRPLPPAGRNSTHAVNARMSQTTGVPG
jgi:hypothetical protein